MNGMLVEDKLFELAERLFPISRSLSGSGVVETLNELSKHLPNLELSNFTSGDKVFDWVVPNQWEIQEAYVIAPDGRRILDFDENNLHVVGYSTPFEGELSLEELDERLHSLPDQPDAVPYVTSYYAETWGFCISHNDRKALAKGTYKVKISSSLFKGVLPYGQVLLPGKSKSEIVLSTYICHPSMANNELSGPIVTTAVMNELSKVETYYSIRALFLPETIGALAYMANNLHEMKANIIAGYVVTCVGDERQWSLLKSRTGDTVADFAAEAVLSRFHADYVQYPWTARGSDERQYCSPGAELPFASIMRSKYGTYPEYHSDKDKLRTVVTGVGLKESAELLLEVVSYLDSLSIPKASNIGEPQMSSRGLYPTLSIKGGYDSWNSDLLDVLSLCDDKTSLDQIALRLQLDLKYVKELTSFLQSSNLLTLR